MDNIPQSCPNTPESSPLMEGDSNYGTSISTVDVPGHRDAQDGFPKQKFTPNNDRPVTPLPKRLMSNCGAPGPFNPPGAPLRGVANVPPHFSRPMLLPSPLLDDKPRQAIGLFEPQISRRNAVARMMPLPYSQHCLGDSNKIYDELAHWYYQFRLQMWSPVACMMGISWEEAEELGWRMGKAEIDQRVFISPHVSRMDWRNNVITKM
ncbi:hypothetical protein EYZ11_012358 [Aspergillus tanneri]|uniref:Uncharacterized protein n=1 Tax=Aspergillus tanneri TaxID=1220188 RepID=A0A4S3J2J9_9EURO|nr:uncharacterized protein ATNIH1004_001688 [Aspergillus tanneri]KAA8652783.1 hypothetical protein ATNIH1004_001688 [Aspergillus tanneri]THC88198.1 hypothetical protein EYZ11_012358 [Aspergillus tanneri]